MECDFVREIILEFGWDQDSRKRVMEAINHLKQCRKCQKALEDYDHLRNILTPEKPDAVPKGGWDEFHERILPKGRSHTRIIRFRSLATAALILLVAGVSWWAGRLWRDTGKAPSRQEMLQQLAYTEKEVKEQVEVFRTLSEVYDRKTGWVLVSDVKSDFGLVPESSILSPEMLMLRLTMLEGSNVISMSNLVVMAGQTAELTIPFTKGRKLKYNISTTAGNPAKFTIWVEVQKENGHVSTVAALATQLQAEPGQVLSAGKLVTSAGKYELNIAFSQAKIKGDKV